MFAVPEVEEQISNCVKNCSELRDGYKITTIREWITMLQNLN